MTIDDLWRRILPHLEAGGVAVDLHQHFGVDLDDDPSPWDTRTWHWIRDRVIRLVSIEGTAAHRVATHEGGVTDVRSRAPGRADLPRGRGDGQAVPA